MAVSTLAQGGNMKRLHIYNSNAASSSLSTANYIDPAFSKSPQYYEDVATFALSDLVEAVP